ncbi:DUF5011 domain-containing protein [Pontibacter sp. Tf4]|uniref:immunoglobulin-like domain-containing protein n=1 Tax=Pontibacter sp. Tf4 TaxID=2761620 RepID=UPI0016280C4D|nr:immunoglobulin-like domain-containing protein [Pontibacter sp. Tf4]MBB6612246.1 DUF5011 domain-containing protein [Pontibacter sp. Tf4]
MKNRNKIIGLAITILMAFTLAACEKDDETAHVSGVTTYAQFEINGDQYVSVVVGGEFNDPGVVAREGETELPVTTTSNLDLTTPGVYDITYTAINSDNFPGSVTRTVAVLPAPEQAGVDISGTYVRSGVTSTVTKLAPGFYLMPNVWGPNLIPSYILTTDGVNLTLPGNALSGFGPVEGSGTLQGGVMSLQVTLPAFGITSTRVWTKQ